MAIIGGGERDLTIKLFANVDNFQKNMKGAAKDTEDFSGKAINFLGKVGIAVAAAGAAVGSFAIKLGIDSVKAAIEAEKQQERLAALLRNTAGATEEQIKTLNDQAVALSKVGVATRDNVTITQSQLATFDLKAGTIAKLTPAILDYVIAEKGATASTDDFKSMTNGLAQALQGNFASLTATGFVLDAATKELIKNGTETERAAALVDVLNSTYKGFNETVGETAEGQLIRLQNAFDDTRVKIGEALLPIVLELLEAFRQNLLPKIVEFTDYLVEKVVPAIDKYVRPAFARLVETLGGLAKGFDDTTKAVVPTRDGINLFGAIVKEITLSVLNGFLNVINAIGQALEYLVRTIGFVVLAMRRDFVGAAEILTGKVNEQNSAMANATREFLNYQRQLDTSTTSLVNAYRELNFYTKLQNEGTAPAVKTTEQAIKALAATTYESATATDTATEATKKFTAAQKDKKKSVDDTTLSLKEQMKIIRDIGGGSFAAAGGANIKSGAQLKESVRSAAEIVSQFGGFVSGFNLNPSDPYYGFGKGSNINTFKAGQGAVQAGNVIINVNGTVVDPEGAARAISTLLTNGSARAGNLPVSTILGIE
jgi:hypothetical protein